MMAKLNVMILIMVLFTLRRRTSSSTDSSTSATQIVVEFDEIDVAGDGFGAESSRSRSHITTINYDFTSSGLTSIMVLGSFSSMLQSRQYVYPQKGILLNAY